MNYILVSHCSFNGNSGIHAFHIAEELHRLGFDCVVSVPEAPESVYHVGAPSFKVVHYGNENWTHVFDDQRGADIVHAFTPRQHVRNETLRLVDHFQCPYVVHLEDNEEEILRSALNVESIQHLYDVPIQHLERIVPVWRIWPPFYRSFLEQAFGVTALIEDLLTFNFGNVPELVFWPGFDNAFANEVKIEQARRSASLPVEKKLLLYAGAVHHANKHEVESLLLATLALRARGYDVQLVKTGRDHESIVSDFANAHQGLVLDLGFVDRNLLPMLVQSADVLVQPGQAGAFNDYRFPSKLPEYLVSGRPVVLPASNIGAHLADGRDALILKEDHYAAIADAVSRLLDQPDLARSIGRHGRAFALEKLSWSGNVKQIADWMVALPSATSSMRKKTLPATGPARKEAPRLIAFYLPQFHTIPENDDWWGKGFTEWTNVLPAQPCFSGHEQPRLPGELGAYDLRNPGVMTAQAALAKAYGVSGFCFYHYWFDGRRLLEDPVDGFLSSGEPDFPFCLCWANENWTRRWDGMDAEILIAQGYKDDWAPRFFRDALPYLKDQRYITVDGEPILLIYRIDLIPDAADVIRAWKAMAVAEGLKGLHVAGVQFIGMASDTPVRLGADATVEFPPHLGPSERTLIKPSAMPDMRRDFEGYVEDYVAAAKHYIRKPPPPVRYYRGIIPSWDNTARRKNRSHIYVNASPEVYEMWLKYLLDYAVFAPGGQPFVFINAWNEWAEGAYLEPDKRYGRAYLEATHRALRGYTPIPMPLPGQSTVPSAQVDDAATHRKAITWGKSPALHFCDRSFVERVIKLYHLKNPATDKLSYATVRDYCDSWDHLQPLACHGDLKNVQRPWLIKTILSRVPLGGKLLEIGGGEPVVAATLARLGYDVTIVDPYDGTGNGPKEYERYRAEFPEVRLVRQYLRPGIAELATGIGTYDAIYSVSVLEHVPVANLRAQVFPAIRMYMKPGGLSIHAVDFVRKGNGAEEHLALLKTVAACSDIGEEEVARVIRNMDEDIETYYLSAEAHNAWRMGQTYDEFPMRVCVSMQCVV